MIDVGSAVGYLMLDASGFESGFNSALQSVRAFQNESTSMGGKLESIGSAMTSVGSSLTKSITLPLAGLGTTITAVTANFEQSMSKVAAIAGIDTMGKEFDALSEKAKEMGATTKFSASEAADAFTYMAMAGWKTEDMLDGIDGIMQLAAASGEDLATTSDIVTDALTAFGLAASDSTHFADVLAAASNNANTNVAMLGESFKYVAPVAGSLKYSSEDIAVALGLMANSGIKASQAGTELRTAITNMVKPTDAMAAVMDKYNLSITDTEGNIKPFMTVMTDLREKMGGLDEATQAAAATTLFGKEAMSGMLAIINASDEDFNKLSEAIYTADGTASKMAETMQDNLTGQLTILKSALEGLAISFGEILVPYLTKAVQWLTGVVDKFNSMDESTKRMIVTISAIAAAIGPVLLIVGKLASSIGSIVSLFSGAGGLSAIFTALTGPIGLVLAAVAALTAAWVTDFGNIREYTAEAFGSIRDFMSDTWNSIVELWNSNFLGIQDIVNTAWSTIETIFEAAFSIISDMVDFWIAVFSGDWDSAWESIKNVFSTIWDTIKTILSNALNILVDTLIRIGVNLWNAAKESFENIKKGFVDRWEAIKSWFNKAKQDPVNTVLSIGTSLFNAGKSIFTSLWDGLKSTWSKITSWVSDAINWISSKVKFWQDESSKVSSGGSAVRGSYASGLSYVPRDMDVRVHEGESIWTKQETDELISALKSKEPSGEITIVTPVYFDGKKVTQVVTKRQLQEVKANG